MTHHKMLEIAVRELLMEKGILTADEIRAAVERMDARGPHLGARIVAKAWTDNVNYEFPVGNASNYATCDALFESVFAATDANFTTPDRTNAVIDMFSNEIKNNVFQECRRLGQPLPQANDVVYVPVPAPP